MPPSFPRTMTVTRARRAQFRHDRSHSRAPSGPTSPSAPRRSRCAGCRRPDRPRYATLLGMSSHDAGRRRPHRRRPRPDVGLLEQGARVLRDRSPRRPWPRCVERARERGVPALAPGPAPRGPRRLGGGHRAARPHPGHDVREVFGPAEPRTVETDLRIARLGPEHAADFVRIMAAGFGFEAAPDAYAMFDGAQFFDGDWATYGAWDGDVPRRRRPDAVRAGDGRGGAVRRRHPARGTQPWRPGRPARRPHPRGTRPRAALRVGRDLAGDRGEPEPVAAQHAPRRTHRGAHAAELGLAQPGARRG